MYDTPGAIIDVELECCTVHSPMHMHICITYFHAYITKHTNIQHKST